jgi:hypothetical protein
LHTLNLSDSITLKIHTVTTFVIADMKTAIQAPFVDMCIIISMPDFTAAAILFSMFYKKNYLKKSCTFFKIFYYNFSTLD